MTFESQEPPEELFHGTATKFLSNIKEKGILKMRRHHVHLSHDIETARKVGSRKGKSCIIIIDSKRMHSERVEFFISENNMWLTDYVDPIYIKEII